MKRTLLFSLLTVLSILLLSNSNESYAQFVICYNPYGGTGTSSDPYFIPVINGDYTGADIALNAYTAGEICTAPTTSPLSNLIWNPIVADAGDVINASNPAPTVTYPTVIGISHIIRFSGSSRQEPYKFSITVTDSGGLNSQTVSFVLVFATSKLSDISMVLDISGSMGITAETGLTDTRLQVLQKAATDFTNIYNVFSIAVNQGQTDKLGVVYFTTTVVPSVAAATPIALDGQQTTIDPVNTEIQAKTPQQSTAMGLGINEGYNQLGLTGTHITNPTDPAYRTKNIILFTDGIQNVSPLVDDPGASTNTLTVGGGTNLVSDGLLKVSIVAMIQTTTPYNALLSRIAAAAGGKFYTVTKASDVNEFFKYSLASALKNRSPQVVEFRYSSLSGGQSTQKFSVNSNVKKVVFELWTTDSTARFSIEKDSVDVTKYIQFIKGDGYLIGVAKLPFKGNPLLVSKGDWTMKITGNGTSNYNAYVMVDDHALKYTSTVNSNRKINTPLDLSIKLNLHGKPFPAATVKALVVKPGQDLGTLLATTPSPRKDNQQLDLSPGNAKLQELLKDSAFFNALLPKEQVITLTLQSDSTYAGTFTGTDVTGPYQVVFKIEGQTPTDGKFVRTEIETTVLELDAVSLDDSSPTFTHTKELLTINIRPRNVSGLYLGPDYGHKINLSVNNTPVTNYTDNLDGSYTFTVTGIPEGSNPTISLTVLDQKVYEGDLNGYGDKGFPQWLIWSLLALILLIILYLLWKKFK